MQSTTINNKIQVIQGDDQIYRYIAINNCQLDLETLEKMTVTGDTWNGSRLCANLIDIRNMGFIDSKARAYAAAQFRPHVAGTAVLINSKISEYFANLYLKFSQPKTPTKLFTSEDDALNWLRSQMAKHKIG
ncbi:MAG: STAS/SEC14 domain-containing protein [Bacteroidales bacterium]|nr:STAS/SEC14 domain-containing protein [Bacteroidales bacterium]